MDSKENNQLKYLKTLGSLTIVPVIMLAGPAVGYFSGAWLDRRLDSSPIATLILVILGFVASAREVTRMLREILKQQSKQ